MCLYLDEWAQLKKTQVYILNRDSQAKMTWIPPLEAHKSKYPYFSSRLLALDGYENPLFAAGSVDYTTAETTGTPADQLQKV
jgi:hypothetical protein